MIEKNQDGLSKDGTGVGTGELVWETRHTENVVEHPDTLLRVQPVVLRAETR